MPAATPIYGFPYPCPGEQIDAGAFTLLANAIDSKLLDLRTQESMALHRPGTKQSRTGFNVALNTDTVITGAGSSYTLPQNGIYLVYVRITLDGGFSPGVTGGRFRVRQNGTARFAATIHAATAGSSPRTSATGPIVGVAGDVVTVEVRYTGTDATMNFDMELSARMIIRTA